ncbi:hypothetical protein C2I18_02970 [Paenibacillus sp. PK3_47]|uniref:hypothetical protein n=1 Tax=Paenibacillus sp. PK3_47 TaxID=2072642 RepID=UPI00201D8C23|nr:hypothetical protein [Paenibacillus sp. PK3_47]UQZ32609.1 hypothetical protein C2I18_02970 [Paenibacillus sp. PK3_47]
MAYNYSRGSGKRNSSGRQYRNNSTTGSSPVETEELSAEDLEIIAAGLSTLGEFFGFLALLKAREVTKSTGGQVDVDPVLFIQSRKKAARRKSRRPR